MKPRASRSPPEDGIPPSVAAEAARLRAQLSNEKEIAILSRLLSDPLMKCVWSELYKRKRIGDTQTEEFHYPARLTNSSIARGLRKNASEFRNKFRKKGEKKYLAEAELMEREAAWHEKRPKGLMQPELSEQDRGAQLFFYHAFQCARDIEPRYQKDQQAAVAKLRRVARNLRNQAGVLQSTGMKREAHKLVVIAEDCEDAAQIRQGNPAKHDPSIIVRDRRFAEIRTFVTSLSTTTLVLFGSAFPRQLAHVANAVFRPQKVEYSMVREWLRTPGAKKKQNRN